VKVVFSKERIIYNSDMKKSRIFLLISLILLFVPTRFAYSAQQSNADLIALVNNARSGRGISFLNTDSALNTSAQIQADFLAAQYGADLEDVFDWHTGPNGEDEYTRALNAGYTLAPGWTVDEIVFGGGDTATINDAISWWLKSAVHVTALLNDDNQAVGAGISSGEGYSYFVVVFGVELGAGGDSGGVASTIPTNAVTPEVAPVTVATPSEDGSVFHTVESGQALWSIAIAYEITVDQILALNGLEQETIIYEGQTLQVRAAFTPTPSPTQTNTPMAPTRTPIPAQTAVTVPTQAATASTQNDGFLGMDNQTMGLTFILISGAGLILVVIGNLARKKTSKSEKKE